jgi:hypothetical protein
MLSLAMFARNLLTPFSTLIMEAMVSSKTIVYN